MDVATHPAQDIAPGREALRPRRVALAVRDLGRVEEFYRDLLGLAVLDRSAASVRLGAGGAGLIDLVHRPGAPPDDPAEAGLFHTAFLLPTRRDLARWLAHALRHGTTPDGASDHAVSEAIYLSDPEGNGVEVYADRPRAAWRWQDGTVAMGTRRLDVPALLRAAEGAPGWAGAPDGTPNGARIGHVHLRVGEAGRAAAFYAGRLGLDVTARRPGAAFLSTSGYHHHLAVNDWSSAGANPRDPHRAGLLGVTMERVGEGATPDHLIDPWGTALRVEAADGSATPLADAECCFDPTPERTRP